MNNVFFLFKAFKINSSSCSILLPNCPIPNVKKSDSPPIILRYSINSLASDLIAFLIKIFYHYSLYISSNIAPILKFSIL